MTKGVCGTVSLMPTSLRFRNQRHPYAASWRHSVNAAERFCLKSSRRVSWRSRLKWLWIEAWEEANFWSVLMSLNFDIAPSLRRNG
jgi:hypothetical protein